MKKVLSVLGGLLLSTQVEAQRGLPASAPLSEIQRQQIVVSLEQLAATKQEVAARLQRCEQDSAAKNEGHCTQLTALLTTYEVTQRMLCAQYAIPARQHGCP